MKLRIGPVAVELTRTEAHRLAVELLQSCIPGATQSTIALATSFPGPDPGASRWEGFGWR